MSASSTFACPHCSEPIEISETLASPIIEKMKKEFEDQLKHSKETSSKEKALLLKERRELEDQKRELDATLEASLQEELQKARKTIALEEASRLEKRFKLEQESQQDKIKHLEDDAKSQTEKLQQLQESERTLRQGQRDLEEQKQDMQSTLEAKMAETLKAESQKIREQSDAKAKQAYALEKQQLEETLKDQNKQLEEAQERRLSLMKKEREFDEKTRAMGITIEKGINEKINETYLKAKQDAEESFFLKVNEKEFQINQMRQTIEELRQKASGVSQRDQGEIMELWLESMLEQRFPIDRIEPVSKGIRGGDCKQVVNNAIGQACGSILWEVKRTKNWSADWIDKVRDDQRNTNATLAVIVSQTLPKEIESFGLLDGVWVTSHQYAIPLTIALRQTLIEVATTKIQQDGQQSKMELIYDYLTGQQFKQRIERMVIVFSQMEDDLNKEERSMKRMWAKRRSQIEGISQATTGMYGHLQGIAGNALQNIYTLELDSITGSDQDSVPFRVTSKALPDSLLDEPTLNHNVASADSEVEKVFKGNDLMEKEKKLDSSKFKPNDIVVHEVFGEGIVLNGFTSSLGYTYGVRFKKSGSTKMINASSKKLTLS